MADWGRECVDPQPTLKSQAKAGGPGKIAARNLRVLRDPVFEIPKGRPPGDFRSYLSARFEEFFEQTARLSGTLAERLAKRDYWMHELSTSLEAVVDCTRQRRHERAWQLMEGILDEHAGTLSVMSLRHAYKVIGSQSWYRLTTWSKAKTRRDVFHMPFEMKPASYRFSPPERPAIYLGNNAYLCWLECGGPSLESSRVARFEIDKRADEGFLDLPANHAAYLEPLLVAAMKGVGPVDPRKVANSPYFDDVEGELVDYLSVWPLLLAIGVQKLEPAPAEPPEYLIPQLLMQWAMKRKNLLGIRYFTSKLDETRNSNDVSINVVLPARTKKAQGFCDFLTDRVRCTPPQSFRDVKKVSDKSLFTKQSADARQSAAGRYMIKWRGRLRPYQRTPFGRMEYWLDRPEFPATRIDAP